MVDLAALVALWQRQLASRIVWPGVPLPPYPEQGREYLLAGNGLFVRAQRPELHALVPVASCQIAGLAPLTPEVELHIPPIPIDLVQRFLREARATRDAQGRLQEFLAYFIWDEGWVYHVPPQVQAHASVHVSLQQSSPFTEEMARLAVVEAHTHGEFTPFFSATDHRDEQGGFRLYLVVGDLDWTPTALARVGVFGHFFTLPLDQLLQCPDGLHEGERTAHDR